MLKKMSNYLNRYSMFFIAICLILLSVSIVLYIQTQQPLTNRLSGDHSWCLYPPFGILSLTFKEDGSFVQKVITPMDYDATAYFENGNWTIHEEQGETWIQVIYQNSQTEEVLIPIKSAIGNYYLRIEGAFYPLEYRTLNLIRCARQSG